MRLLFVNLRDFKLHDYILLEGCDSLFWEHFEFKRSFIKMNRHTSNRSDDLENECSQDFPPSSRQRSMRTVNDKPLC